MTEGENRPGAGWIRRYLVLVGVFAVVAGIVAGVVGAAVTIARAESGGTSTYPWTQWDSTGLHVGCNGGTLLVVSGNGVVDDVSCAVPTSAPTMTSTVTGTSTATVSATSTMSASPSPTSSATVTPSATPTLTNTPTPTWTPTASATVTGTATASETPTATASATATPTMTLAPSVTTTKTPTTVATLVPTATVGAGAPSLALLVSCVGPNFGGAAIQISWTDPRVVAVELGTKPIADITSFYRSVPVGSLSTTGPGGFTATLGGSVVIQPNTTYYVSVNEGVTTNVNATIVVPACGSSTQTPTITATSTISATPTSTPTATATGVAAICGPQVASAFAVTNPTTRTLGVEMVYTDTLGFYYEAWQPIKAESTVTETLASMVAIPPGFCGIVRIISSPPVTAVAVE